MSTETFKIIFEGKQKELEKMMDIEHGLLSKLEASKVITRSQRADIAVNFVAVGVFMLNTAVLCFVK